MTNKASSGKKTRVSLKMGPEHSSFNMDKMMKKHGKIEFFVLYFHTKSYQFLRCPLGIHV